MPKPIAPDCPNDCPTIVVYPDGSESATFCEDCDRYLDRTVATMNADKAIEKMNADPSL